MMQNLQIDGTRYISSKTIKAKFNDIEDFAQYWTKNDLKLYGNRPDIFPPDKISIITNEVIDEVKNNLQKKCEIIHFSDFGIAPERCEREYVLIRKNKEVIHSILIKMS